MTDGIRNVTDKRTLLGAYFAALNAEAAIDTVLPVLMRARSNGYGAASNNGNTELGASFYQDIGHSTERMRAIGIAMWVTPRVVGRASDRNFSLQEFIIRFEFIVRNRPVYGDSVF
jgi:hypothetical protein